MNRWEIGMLAKSLAGHDKNKIYVIADMDEAYVYLVDGEYKTFNKMKKKKKIHVQLIRKMHNMEEADDMRVRCILNEYAKCSKGMKEEI